MSARLTPLAPDLGVEITGLRGRDLVDRSAADACLAALRRYGVVVYRGLGIADADLVALSRLLGEVVISPTGESEHPEIQTITFDPNKTNAQLIAFRRGNFFWHFDGAHDALPQKATLLAAREVAGKGGDTEFASTRAAYAALAEAEQEAIAELRVRHSFAAAQRLAHPVASAQEQAIWERIPPRVHPLVWKQRDGRKSLLLGATAAEVVGWLEERGRALLERLLAWCTQPRFVLRHRWQRGDLVIWDNTAMLHRALPFDPKSPRLLHRTTLAGEEPL